MKKLAPKQARFVQEYLVDLNATAAYKRAGYKAKGNAAEVNAARLLRNAQVAAAIQAARNARAQRTEVTADRVVQELARVAFLDPRRIFAWGPDGVTPVDSAALTEDEAACVVEASETVTESGGTIRVKLASKMEALSLLGKHLGMFVNRHEHSGPGGGPIALDLTKLNDDQLAALDALLDAATPPDPG